MPVHQASYSIVLKGKASGRVWEFGPFNNEDDWGERTLLQLLLDQGLGVAHACGGQGTCKTCRVNFHGLTPPLNGTQNDLTLLSCALGPQTLASIVPPRPPESSQESIIYLSIDYL